MFDLEIKTKTLSFAKKNPKKTKLFQSDKIILTIPFFFDDSFPSVATSKNRPFFYCNIYIKVKNLKLPDCWKKEDKKMKYT